MMDLAEIRKKARLSKKKAPPPEELPEAQKAQEAQEAALPVPSGPVPEPFFEPSKEEALDALFSAPFELVLTEEERGLQDLVEKGEDSQKDYRQWLTFSLGKENYALDIGSINEIIKPREITDIPRVPDFVLGIVSLRGVITPVFDLKKRLKLGEVELSSTSRIIVCQQGDKSVGLLVDGIDQVVRLPEESIEPPPGILSGVDRDLVDGVGRHDGRMMIMLHLPSVLDAELT